MYLGTYWFKWRWTSRWIPSHPDSLGPLKDKNASNSILTFFLTTEIMTDKCPLNWSPRLNGIIVHRQRPLRRIQRKPTRLEFCQWLLAWLAWHHSSCAVELWYEASIWPKRLPLFSCRGNPFHTSLVEYFWKWYVYDRYEIRLSLMEKAQFLNLWYVIICINDILIIIGTILKEIIENRRTDSDLWDMCSACLGVGNLLV